MDDCARHLCLLWLVDAGPIFMVLVGDALSYDQLAYWLALDKPFSLDGVNPTASRPPLYPFFVSIFYRLFGHHLGPVFIAQCGLLIGTALLLRAWLRLDHPEMKSSVAAILCAAWPVLAAYATTLLSETLFTFLLVAAAYRYRKERADETGILLGLAALTRSIILYFPACWLAWRWMAQRRFSREDVVFLGLFAIVLTPWAMRNWDRFGVFLPVSVGGDYALWAGSHAGRYPDSQEYNTFAAPYAWGDPAGEAVIAKKALQVYARNLPRILLDLPRRSFKLWITSHSEMFGGGKIAKLLGFILQLSLLAFATLGTWRARTQPQIFFPLAIICYIWTLVVLTDWGPARYCVPMIPFLIYLGAHGF